MGYRTPTAGGSGGGIAGEGPAFYSIGSHNFPDVDRCGISIPTTSTAWVAGLAVYVPFYLESDSTVYEFWWGNGSGTTVHNIDVGIYTTAFVALQTLTSTAGATTASAIVNTSTWTDLALTAGAYYMGFVDDSTRNIETSADAVGLYQASGIMEQTGLSSTLPNPMVPVVYTRAFLPQFGLNLRSTAL
jgi:hypothetical protein